MSAYLTKRRLSALIVILTLMLSLAACSKPEEAPDPRYKGTLTLWAAPGLAGHPAGRPAGDWFRERADAYEALHDGIKVEVNLFTSPQELEQGALARSFGPDLLFGRFLPELAPRLADVGALTDYHPNGVAAFRHGDRLLGVPVLLEVHGLALNEQLFASKSVALPVNGEWTIDQFEESLRKVSGTEQFGLGFYHLPRYHEWWGLAAGILNADGTLATGAEEGLTRLRRWQADGLLHPDTAKVGAEEIWTQFATGRIAAMPIATWAIPLLRAEPYTTQFSVAGLPGGLSVGYTYGFSLFAQEDAAKLAAAADLAAFMAAPDQQVRLARETGLMPASAAAPNPFADDPHMTQAFRLTASQRPLPAGPAWDAAQPAVSEWLLKALIGAEQPGAALKQIESAMTPALR